MLDDWLFSRALIWIPVILSLSVHEWAHAWTAWILGDDTARLQGRMTLNPVSHIDPLGTLLLPLAGIPFGWAKPVPFNPSRFRKDMNMRTGILLTAAAGPLSNLALAAAALFLLAVASWMTGAPGIVAVLRLFVLLNVLLAFFNALPIPPLDGSLVVDSLMPDRLQPLWNRFCRYGPYALAAVVLLPALAGVGILDWAVSATFALLDQIAPGVSHF